MDDPEFVRRDPLRRKPAVAAIVRGPGRVPMEQLACCIDVSRDCNSVAEAPMSQRNAALAVCLTGRPGPLPGKSPARLTDAHETTGVRAA